LDLSDAGEGCLVDCNDGVGTGGVDCTDSCQDCASVILVVRNCQSTNGTDESGIDEKHGLEAYRGGKIDDHGTSIIAHLWHTAGGRVLQGKHVIHRESIGGSTA